MRILIAEDDADISESYKDASEARDHKVLLTDDGEECLKVYYEELKQTLSKGDDKTSLCTYHLLSACHSHDSGHSLDIPK